MYSTSARCSKVHGKRLMISKYGSAIWSPHSAEVYIGFERASSCPRLISPTAACIRALYIHARGFPVNAGLTCAFSRFTRITFGNGAIAKRDPSQDHVWQGTRNLRGRPHGVRFSIFNARFSTVDVEYPETVSSQTHFVRKCLETFGKF